MPSKEINKQYLRLQNDILIPPIGFGTDRTFIYFRKNIICGALDFFDDIFKQHCYHLKRDISINKILKCAPEMSCHLFDTASAYGNSERILGRALKKKDREKQFIITKLSNKEQRTTSVEKALRQSLNRMNLDYVDLYLIHWPQTGTYLECWKQMEKVYKKGLAKSIGVCNCNIHHLEEIKKIAEIMPMVNQVECHPLFHQKELHTYCIENKIQMMAYTATGRMNPLIKNDENLKKIAAKHQKSITQIIIKWHIQNKIIPIVNTTNLNHLSDNFDVFDFNLSDDQMRLIDLINKDMRLRYDPDTVDFTKC